MRTWGVLPAVVLLVAFSGCAGTKTVTERASQAATTPTRTALSLKPHKAQSKAALNNPAQQPDPSTRVSCDESAMGHACQSGTTVPSDPNQSPQRNCDTNIVANSGTSCGLAENAFYEYYESSQDKGQRIMVHSPTTGKDYELFCEEESGLVGCTGSPLSTGIYTSFPMRAIAEYTSLQADEYARKRDVGHPGTPATQSSPSMPQSEPESGIAAGSQEGEDEVGSYSHAGDEEFCNMHECIGDFEGEGGYVVECSDGSYSHAGGISGACSDHGGEN